MILSHVPVVALKFGWSATLRMAERGYKTYEETVAQLNTLQSNAQAITDAVKNNTHEFASAKLQQHRIHLNSVGIKVEDIDVLKPIHVAGTKGKGSVCAMCESILRAHGHKTGFLSSPHLLEVRERIRINGVPISKELFVRYFWECYDKLCETADDAHPLPPYVSFLNIMCYKVFFGEKVDVAVIEVGIGGSYDYTNVLNQPKVCAVTSLGYDHTEMLGNTMKKIAWHKAGIFKPGAVGFTVSQPSEGLEVIRDRAEELGLSSIAVSPKFSTYPNPSSDEGYCRHHIAVLGIQGEHQFDNASLAVQICKAWLNDKSTCDTQMLPDTCSKEVVANGHVKENSASEIQDKRLECGIQVAQPFHLSRLFLKGLQDCQWPGRCQVLNKPGVSYFVDGAHTNRSLGCCAKWFKTASLEDSIRHKNKTILRVLLFSFSGKRDPAFLMAPLLDLDFDYPLFSPYMIKISNTKSSDQTNLKLCNTNFLPRCQENAQIWKRLHQERGSILDNEPVVFSSIPDAIEWVDNIKSDSVHVQLLVCGSLYLVAGVLTSLGYDTDSLLEQN